MERADFSYLIREGVDADHPVSSIVGLNPSNVVCPTRTRIQMEQNYRQEGFSAQNGRMFHLKGKNVLTNKNKNKNKNKSVFRFSLRRRQYIKRPVYVSGHHMSSMPSERVQKACLEMSCSFM